MHVRRVRVLACSLLVAAASVGCSAPDPVGLYGQSHPTGGGGGGSDAATSSGPSGGGGGGGGNGGGGPGGGADASAGNPTPVTSDAGANSGPDAAGSGGSGDAATPAPDASLSADGFDQFQHRNLDDVNKYRATLGVAPLVLDKQLCTFSAAGSLELSSDHLPHQHFINASNDGSLWTSGFNSTAAENQGDPNGWGQLASDPTQNELQQIDAIQQAMFDEGPGTGDAHGHYTNIMDPTSTRLGVGLLEVGGQLYLTNDFSQ